MIDLLHHRFNDHGRGSLCWPNPETTFLDGLGWCVSNWKDTNGFCPSWSQNYFNFLSKADIIVGSEGSERDDVFWRVFSLCTCSYVK